MKFIILKQKDGNLYICQSGESWGFGIVVSPEVWNFIPEENKKEFYNRTHKEQFKEK